MVVGRLLSFWEGPFTGAMLVLGRVAPHQALQDFVHSTVDG